MAHKTHLAAASASAAADAVLARANGGYLRIYTNPVPASPDTALTTQVLLGELRFGTPAFGPAVAGVATSNAITPEANAPATGTASWFRILGADGTTVVLDGNIDGPNASLNLSSTAITAGARIEVASLTYTQPVE